MSKETFEIIENVALLRTADTGWTRELSKVSWYHKPTTIDIRWWSPQKKKQEKAYHLRWKKPNYCWKDCKNVCLLNKWRYKNERNERSGTSRKRINEILEQSF